MPRPQNLLATAAQDLGRAAPPRLSIDANRFTLIDSTGNEKPINALTLDVVFIDLNTKVSKMYWGKEYDPNSTGDMPLCFSDNGTAPSTQAVEPQSPRCFDCAHNAIGSAVSKFTGAKIKACVDMKKLAFIVPGDQSRLIYLMTVKPGSFKNWASYINWLKVQKMQSGGAPDLPDVVTRLSFESQGVLKFEPAAITEGNVQLLAQMEEAWGRNVTADIVGANDQPRQDMLPAPARAPQQLTPPMPTHIPPAPVFQQAPTPMQAPFTAGPGSFTLPQQPPAAQPAQPVERKKRGRPANATPQPAPTPASPSPFTQGTSTPSPQGQAAAAPLEIPPFLQRAPQQPMPPAPSFGMATPEAAGAELQAAIDAAFKLPT